jgi:hypothetical protein
MAHEGLSRLLLVGQSQTHYQHQEGKIHQVGISKLGIRGVKLVPGNHTHHAYYIPNRPLISLGRKVSHNGSEIDDNASLMSYAPTLRANGDLASLLDEGLNSQSPAWRLLSSQSEAVNPFESVEFLDSPLTNFESEFDEIDDVDNKLANEGMFTFNYTFSVLITPRGGVTSMESKT